jgi:ssDNA-binding Zn-finger/Zn-ribbon topoisomerase 1
MEIPKDGKADKRLMISAHVCPQCGFAVDLKDIAFRDSATGLVTCPKCERSGPISIGIIPKDPVK